MPVDQLTKKQKDKYIQAANELKKYISSKEYRSMQVERAFIKWYVLARYGKAAHDDLALVDRAREGGVDALFEKDGLCFILQSKYEKVIRISKIEPHDIRDFNDVASIFKSESRENLERWMIERKIRAPLYGRYRNAWRRIKENPNCARFIFITSKLSHFRKYKLVRVASAPNVLSLWDLYRDGFTPPCESINLKLIDYWKTGASDDQCITHVGLADVRDFLAMMDRDKNERLFAQNVRTNLKSTINRDIMKTYEGSPEKFWLGNNGIYIVCRKIHERNRGYTLEHPYIINGSQTLHAISHSAKRHFCKILVRILEMDVLADKDFLLQVIRRTNTQNPMKSINLVAHDHSQHNIARHLDNFRIFYERREKEWHNEKKDVLSGYMIVNVKEVGQWLSTQISAVGLGRARSRVSEMFDVNYKQIFAGFNKELKSKSYDKLTTVVWSALLVQSLIRRLPKNKRAQARMSQLLLIKAVAAAGESDRRLKRQIKDKLEAHEVGRGGAPKELTHLIRQVHREFVCYQKAEEKVHENIDYSNYFKRDDLTKKAYRKSFNRSRLQQISRILKVRLAEIT